MAQEPKPRPLEEIKADSRLFEMGYDIVGVVINAYVDFQYKGQPKTAKQHKADADTLKRALEIVQEYRQLIEHNLAGYIINDIETGGSLTLCPWVIPDSPVGPGPVLDAVWHIIIDHAQWLEHPSINYTERKNKRFMSILGRHWHRRNIDKATIATLREIYSIVFGKELPSGNNIDSDIFRAFDVGWQDFEDHT